MGKELIKRHNFDVAKDSIEKLYEIIPENPRFDKVEEDGGLFGLGDHNVTGKEMNIFTDKVQDKLIDINDTLIEVISGFEDVYKAFDYLDKEYIAGIICSVDNAEKASKQALQAQEDIKENVENLRRTVDVLVGLKNRIESIENTLNSQSSSSIQNHPEKNTEEYSCQDRAEQSNSFQGKVKEVSTQMLERKIKLAYYIGGGAIALTLIDVILQLLGIL